MGAATALQASERIANLRIASLRVALQERHGSHHPSIGAVAALRNFLLQPRCLERMRLRGCSETGKRGDLAFLCCADW